MSSATPSLTSHLVSLSTVRPYSAATEHAFLTQAGKGTLSKDVLGLYLCQDRLFVAHSAIAFLGQVFAKIPFSSSRPFNSPRSQALQRIVRTIDYALKNVIREVNFFNDVAEKFGLDVDGWKERKVYGVSGRRQAFACSEIGNGTVAMTRGNSIRETLCYGRKGI